MSSLPREFLLDFRRNLAWGIRVNGMGVRVNLAAGLFSGKMVWSRRSAFGAVNLGNEDRYQYDIF